MKRYLVFLLLFFCMINILNAKKLVIGLYGEIIPKNCIEVVRTPIAGGGMRIEPFLKTDKFEAWVKKYFEQKGYYIKKVVLDKVYISSRYSSQGVEIDIELVDVIVKIFHLTS